MFILYTYSTFKGNIVNLCLQFIIYLNIVCVSSLDCAYATAHIQTKNYPSYTLHMSWPACES